MHQLLASSTPLRKLSRHIPAALAAPVDGASLALFRIFFGMALLWEACEFLWPNAQGNVIQVMFHEVRWNVPYHGFEWVVALPPPWLTVIAIGLGLSGVLFALGLFYRCAAVTAWLSFTYLFLLDATLYNNHFYLISLLAFLFIWLPAQACFSVDAWRRSRRHSPDVRRSATVPCWSVFLLRGQLFVVYFFGGIAKLDADWLSGAPMKGPSQNAWELLHAWLGVGGLIGPADIAWFLAWSGLLFDLAIVPLLVFRRTRMLAIVLVLLFHGTNHFLFSIGVFPFLGFTGTLIFLDADWPRQFWSWCKRPSFGRPNLKWLIAGTFLIPVVGALLGWAKPKRPTGDREPCHRGGPAVLLVVLWLTVQLLLPLRHFFIPGDASWTDEGHRFSWRMMLRAKAATLLLFEVVDREFTCVNARGKTQTNWDRWPADAPQATYVPVNSAAMKWEYMPELTVIYEPWIGERIIYNPRAASAPSLKDRQAYAARVRRLWKRTFGREPQILESVSLPDALHRARMAATSSAAGNASDELGRLFDQAQRQISSLRLESTPLSANEPRVVELSRLIQRLVDSEQGAAVRQLMARTHPFSLSSVRADQPSFLIVCDPQLQAERRLELRKLASGGRYLVWFDFSRLRPLDWQGLPQEFACLLDKKLHVFWNPFSELNYHQVAKISTRPFMIHQYARRIADLWEDKTQRRPEVRVKCYVSLNHRRPQLLIDPTTDLARVPLALFAHNAWIEQPVDSIAQTPSRRRVPRR